MKVKCTYTITWYEEFEDENFEENTLVRAQLEDKINDKLNNIDFFIDNDLPEPHFTSLDFKWSN